MRPIRVLIADDVDQVRQDLRLALELAGGVEVLGEAVNGREAVDLAARLRPDVILMDLEMPELGGCEASRQIRISLPECRVIALTVHGDEVSHRKALASGMDAFVVKGAGLKALMQVITQREE